MNVNDWINVLAQYPKSSEVVFLDDDSMVTLGTEAGIVNRYQTLEQVRSPNRQGR